MTLRLLSAITLAAFTLPILAQVSSPHTSIAIKLTPHLTRPVGKKGLQVDYVLQNLSEGHLLRLRLDTLEPSLQRTSDNPVGLAVHDANGDLSMDAPTRSHEDNRTWQIWTSKRPLRGPVAVRYFVPVAPHHPPKRGPHVDLQEAGGGISGALESVLLLPAINGSLDVALHWELRRGDTAVSTFALGDFRVRKDLDRLTGAVFLAGHLQVLPHPAPGAGFSMYALGVPRSSLAKAFTWSERLYNAERRSFRASASQPFRYMIRSYDGGPIDSGHANNGSFLLYLQPSTSLTASNLRELVAHEMVHGFTQELTGDPGSEGDWYTEGIADYFEVVLPELAGLYTREQYLRFVNQRAAAYYTNPDRELSNRDASTMKWSKLTDWSLLYDRGALYFADLDAKLKTHHAGFSVLDLVNEMNAQIDRGAPRTDQTWLSLLHTRVGNWAIEDWTRMRDGQLLLPDRNAFGSCITGEEIESGFFDLGYSPARTSAGTTITSVEQNSSAEKAGLFPHDILNASFNVIPFTESFDRRLTITIRRGRQMEAISYDPHQVVTVKAMHWVHVRTQSCESRP